MKKIAVYGKGAELFDYSMEAEIKAYYAAHYGYELSDEEVSFILNPAKAAAAGYIS